MSPGRFLTLVLLAMLLLLSGAAMAASQPQITDPDDDARVRTSEALVPYPSCSPCDPVVSEQAPDALELIAVSFGETRSDLVVRLQVAGLEEGLEEATRAWDPTDPSEIGPGEHEASYGVCWTTIDDQCTEGVALQVWRARGEVSTRSMLLFTAPGCTLYIPCTYLAPYTIETGSPGVIEWHLPRGLLPNASQGDTLEDPMAFIHRTEDKADSIRIESGGVLSLPLTGDPTWGYAVDEAREGEPFTFQTPLEQSLPPVLRSPQVQDPPDDFDGPDRDDLDILNVTFGADHQNLTVSVELAQVAQDPEDYTLFVNAGFRDGIPLLQLLAWVEDGERQFSAQQWASYENGSQVELSAVVVPGQPGWINMSTSLADVPVVGKRLAWMWAGALSQTPREELRSTRPFLEPLETQVTSYQVDIAGPGTAYNVTPMVAAGTEAVLPSRDNTTIRVDDDHGDAQLPGQASLFSQAPDQNSADSYDLTRIGAEAESPSLLQLSLEIRNLSRVRVPPSYDGVLYAAAVETPQGRFMAVAHYQGGPTDPGETTAEWFCTSDTSVLTEDPALPPPGIPIEGFLRPSQAQQGTGTQGSGVDAMVRFDVPRECLADAPTGPLDIRSLGGGVFLVRNAPGQGPTLEAVDRAVAEVGRTVEPAPLTLASTNAPPGGSLLNDPFGIGNFWDLVGIAGTLVASGIGAVLVRRRRSALKEYLREIDRILDEHPRDPSGREASLRSLESRAKDDLVKGRLTENQYVVVRTRLTEELAEARGKSIEEAFGELPHRLLTKLKQMASDGTLSPEDRRLFSALLEDSELKEQAKERVRRKLDAWAQSDPSPE